MAYGFDLHLPAMNRCVLPLPQTVAAQSRTYACQKTHDHTLKF